MKGKRMWRDWIIKMFSKFDLLITFLFLNIGTSSKICCYFLHTSQHFGFFLVCMQEKKANVMDSICSFGGNAACRTYCFFTQASLTGYCDADNNCICNSTLTTNNNNVVEEIEIFVINKWSKRCFSFYSTL